jgi:hypothetical protein
MSNPPLPASATSSSPSPWGLLAAAWGLVGVSLLLLRAIVSLSPRGIEAMADGLSWWQWAILIAWTLFMAYSEGYRGFQKRFSPMVAARLHHLAHRPTWAAGLLAPAFAMGLFNATRRRLIISWSLLVGIALLVILVRLVPQPWRGIIDVGVVVGLTWGGLSLLVLAARVAITGEPWADAELPAPRDAA